MRVLSELIDGEAQRSEAGNVEVSASLDRSALDLLRELEGGGGALRSLAETFMRDAPERVTQLADAAHAGDLPGVAAAAHSLRGSAATFGATELAALAGRIELDAKAGHTSPSGVIEQVELLLASAVSALTEEIYDHSPEVSSHRHVNDRG